MKIITVCNQKGGTGKSTLVLNLGFCFALNLKVGVLDTDLQGSLTGISEFVKGISFIPYNTKPEKLRDFGYDVILADSPPYLSNQLAPLFAVSDFILIPSKAGFFDLMAIRSTIELVKQAQAKQPNLKTAIVLTMVKSKTNLTDEIKDVLKTYDAPLLNAVITDRVSYTRSTVGNGIFETDDVRAQDEIIELTKEITTFF